MNSIKIYFIPKWSHKRYSQQPKITCVLILIWKCPIGHCITAYNMKEKLNSCKPLCIEGIIHNILVSNRTLGFVRRNPKYEHSEHINKMSHFMYGAVITLQYFELTRFVSALAVLISRFTSHTPKCSMFFVLRLFSFAVGSSVQFGFVGDVCQMRRHLIIWPGWNIFLIIFTFLFF